MNDREIYIHCEKHNAEQLRSDIKYLNNIIKIKQQRIDKAIEYIDNAQTLDYGTIKEFNIKEFPFVQHILEILKGKSE